MKISILVVTIEQDDRHAAEPQSPPGPTDDRPQSDHFLANLFFDLLRETSDSPQETWEVVPHGPFFKV